MEKATDMTFLRNFTGGNGDKMKKYINMFLTVCPDQIGKMKSHLSAQDYDGVRAVAHALKPQITYMGIRGGEEIIKAIETNAGQRTGVESLPKMLEDFSQICERAMEELRGEIA